MDRLIGGRYRLVRKIAEGGMGEVYEAQHNLSKKAVALKILFPHIGKDEAARQRFLREVSAPAQIGHDNIVEVLDAGFDTEDGSLFVAMELLDGEPLRDRLEKGGVSLDTLLDWFELMLDPLAAAHDKGIVHRDLKPENVFMAKKRDGSEIIKILDFGIARDLDGSQTNVTHTGIAMGTPHYMAPEQAMSAKGVSPAADVWALGVMLYEALAGRPPFDGETPSAIVVLACTRAHTPLSQIAPHVPGPLAAFVDRCLAKDPRGRPQSCREMLHELRQVRRQMGSSPGAAASGLTSIPGSTGPITGQSTPGGTALLPQTSGGGLATPGPSGGFGSPVATPSPAGGYAPSTPSGFGGQSGGFGMSPTAPGFGGPASGGFAYGGKPKSGRGGLAIGLLALVLVGGLMVAGAGVVAALYFMSNDAATERPNVSYATVRIQTDVSAGRLFVDGTSRGPVVPNQEFRIERGSHTIEIRENGLTVASARFNAVAGREQELTLNRTGGATTQTTQTTQLAGNVQALSGQLQPGDGLRAGGQYVDTHTFDWTAGSTVRVDLDSAAFDTFLIVTSPSGHTQQNDDRPNGGLNSGLTITVTETGRWRVGCSTFSGHVTGAYSLRVRGL